MKYRVATGLLAALLLLIVVFVPSGLTEVSAAGSSGLAELEDKLEAARQQRIAAQAAVNAAKNERADAISEKQAIDAKILALNTEMDALEQLIAGCELQIADKNREIAEETERLNAQYEIVCERIRANYEDGGADMLSILFDSDGLTDFFMRVDRFTCMLEYNNRLMAEFTSGIEELNRKKEEIIASSEQLEAQKSELELRRDELEDDLAAAEKLVSDAEADVAKATAALASVEAAEKQYNTEREQKLAELQKASNQSYVGGVFLWPLPAKYTTVSCGFGWRTHPVTGKAQYHLGIDIPAPYGTEIYAVNDGTVIEVSYNYADGYYITISHGGGVASFYSHISKYCVKVGDKVKRGQVIAYVGTSGYTTGAHLNLNIYENSKAVDPMGYFTAD